MMAFVAQILHMALVLALAGVLAVIYYVFVQRASRGSGSRR